MQDPTQQRMVFVCLKLESSQYIKLILVYVKSKVDSIKEAYKFLPRTGHEGPEGE